MLLLLFAAAVRHTGGYAWAYNTRLYFQAYHPSFDSDLGYWLLGCSIGGGSFGVFFGGFLSDRLVRFWTESFSRTKLVFRGRFLKNPTKFWHCTGSL